MAQKVILKIDQIQSPTDQNLVIDDTVNILGQLPTDLSNLDAKIDQTKADILGGVGPAFDTLQELSTALGDDANALVTLTNTVGEKANRAGDTFTGAITAPEFIGDLTGTADASVKWVSPRNLELAGDVSGSINLDGSADVTMTVSFQNIERIETADSITYQFS